MKQFFTTLILVLICCIYTNAEPRTRILVKTTKGDITLELYNETPKHRDNFIRLCKEHFFDGILFHRVILQVA